MLGVKPYIAFNGNCADAIDFYTACLNAQVLFKQTYGESPMAQEGMNDKIMHTSIKIGDSVIMACDVPNEHWKSDQGNISLALGSDDVAAAEKMFHDMSDGGTVTMPMQETFWAERFGMLTDKFGVNWMFNCEKTGQAAE